MHWIIVILCLKVHIFWKGCKILWNLHLFWLYVVHTVKSKVKISQNFVAFSKYMNFKKRYLVWKLWLFFPFFDRDHGRSSWLLFFFSCRFPLSNKLYIFYFNFLLGLFISLFFCDFKSRFLFYWILFLLKFNWFWSFSIAVKFCIYLLITHVQNGNSHSQQRSFMF